MPNLPTGRQACFGISISEILKQVQDDNDKKFVI
jgi:hypothetical protein